MNHETNANYDNEEVVSLIEGYCNDTLDDVGLARLEDVLIHDGAARLYFRRYLGLDSALHEHGASAAAHWYTAPKELARVVAPGDSGQSSFNTSAGHDGVQSSREKPTPRAWRIDLPWRWDRKVQFFGLTGMAVLGVAIVLAAILGQRGDAAPVGTLEQVVGDVRLLGADGQVRAIETSVSIRGGDTVRTRGSESSTVVVFPDGTRLTLGGNTSVTCGDHRSKCVVVHQGMLAAQVKPQPTEKPLLLTTPSAQIQVLGTRFQMEALENRTDLSVTEGRVRLVRIRDQKAVEVPDGKFASVTEINSLQVQNIPGLPQTWEEDFETGLPEGWVRGEWIINGLPSGTRGGVKATFGEIDGGGGTNYSIDSQNGWMQGLFAVQKNSHLHFTFKSESQKWINIFIVTRTAGPDVCFSGNYLLEDFPKLGSGHWENITIPLADFKRIHSGTESLMDVVPFKLMFVFDEPDRGFIIDRVWVTTDGPGRVVSEEIR